MSIICNLKHLIGLKKNSTSIMKLTPSLPIYYENQKSSLPFKLKKKGWGETNINLNRLKIRTYYPFSYPFSAIKYIQALINSPLIYHLNQVKFTTIKNLYTIGQIIVTLQQRKENFERAVRFHFVVCIALLSKI